LQTRMTPDVETVGAMGESFLPPDRKLPVDEVGYDGAGAGAVELEVACKHLAEIQ
jgi:hypothetical protein